MKFFKFRNLVVSGVALILAVAAPLASADLSLRAGFQDAALSIDAATNNNTVSGVLEVEAAASGSDVIAAFLYVADVFGSGNDGDVTLNGTFIPEASKLAQLIPNLNPANTSVYDVLSIVEADIEGGTTSFSYAESGNSDGAVLVVAYRSAATSGSTAIILDGELARGGDTTTLNFDAPYAGGDVIMSLADSFSFGASQFTNVTVNTDSTVDRVLTTSAGGNDDGGFVPANGQLITAGGFGDDPSNPDPTAKGQDADDELYNLALGNSADATPFLQNGDTFVQFDTNNPSNDDNVFALFFTSSFRITDVDDTPIPDDCPPDCPTDDDPAPMPEPGTVFLLGLGLLGVTLARRRRQV